MTALEIIFNIISMIIVEISISMIVSKYYHKFKKIEKEDESKASQLRYVKMNEAILNTFIIFSIISSICGIVIFAFPKFITNILGFNYLATIIVWWIPLIFDNTILCFMLTEAKFDDEKIVVKKALSKAKIYKYEDIVKFSNEGNLKVKTKNGSFVLLNAMTGTNALRQKLKSIK